MKLDERLKKIEIVFVGEHDWEKMRDLMVLKMSECETEKEFTFFLKVLIGSCFLDADSINEARRRIGAPELSKEDVKKINRLGKNGKHKKSK